MIRLAKIEDMDKILLIKDEAIKLLADNNIDQWQDGYPNKEVFLNDINNSDLYVFDNGKILAFMALVKEKDPNFETLEGVWLSDSYLTIHRIAVAREARNQGIANELFSFAKNSAKEKSIDAVRIDTHENNIMMQNLIKKNGFSYRGWINKGKRAERLAYEFLI